MRRRGAAAANAHGGEALEATRADEGCRGRSGVLAASGRTTNANPAGFFATHTLDVGPNLCTSLSTSCWVTCEAGLGLLLGARLCARAEEGPACLRVEIPKVQPLALARHRWERCTELCPRGAVGRGLRHVQILRVVILRVARPRGPSSLFSFLLTKEGHSRRSRLIC